MSCASCVARVEKGLLRLEGVAEAAVNLGISTKRLVSALDEAEKV